MFFLGARQFFFSVDQKVQKKKSGGAWEMGWGVRDGRAQLSLALAADDMRWHEHLMSTWISPTEIIEGELYLGCVGVCEGVAGGRTEGKKEGS